MVQGKGKDTKASGRRKVEVIECDSEDFSGDVEQGSSEEVFDLAGDDEDVNSSEDDSKEESEGDDSNSETEATSLRNTKITQLLDNLDPQLRQRVIMGRGGDVESEDEEEDDYEMAVSDLHESSGWGKKGNYWSGDTGDLEIGQDLEDAEDEEEAAKALRLEQLSRRRESDYVEEEESNSDESDGDLETPTDGFGNDRLTEDLEFVATGGVKNSRNTSVEKLARNVSKMSKKQRLALLAAEAPEMLGLLEELNDRVKELQERITPVKNIIQQAGQLKPVDDELCIYLEVKQQLLLSYCINTTFYLMLKAEGKSVRSHPVIKQLLHLRYAMEKMRPLDGKVKYQIDRLLAAEHHQGGDLAGSVALKPNVAALMRGGGDGDGESDDGSDWKEEDNSRGREQLGVYKPPKSHAVPYLDDKDSVREEEKFQRKKKKLKNSEILETLREEFGHAPEQASSSGIAAANEEQKRLKEEEEERRRFEEERFVRLTLSRKDKKSMKRREKLSQSQDMVADIGDIGDFEDLTALSNSIAVKASSSSGAPSAAASMSGGADLSGALQKAVSALMGGETNGKKGKKRSTAEYDTDGLQNHRRPVPSTDDYASDEGGAFGADDDDDLMETFARKKKEFAKKKVEHYTAPARIGGREEVVADGAKRAASYEIMSNRGLTPHRKKSNRNPRVKKREAFAKAVVARKGQVRDVISGSDVAYGGEATGIKSNLSRSRRIGT